MLTTDFTKIMEKSNGTYIYKGFIPSLKKHVDLLSMTTGQVKTVVKSALSDEYNMNEDLKKLNLIAELLLDDEDTEEIDITTLKFVDIVSLLSAIRINNPVSEASFQYECPKCDKKFEFSLDFERIEKNCKEYNLLKHELKFKTKDDNEIKIILRDPDMLNEISFNIYCKQIMDVENMSDDEKTTAILTSVHIKYISEIFINDDKVENFNELKFMEKMEFLEKMPSNIIYGKDGILKTITNLLEGETPLFEKIACKYCETEIEGGLTLESFFIV